MGNLKTKLFQNPIGSGQRSVYGDQIRRTFNFPHDLYLYSCIRVCLNRLSLQFSTSSCIQFPVLSDQPSKIHTPVSGICARNQGPKLFQNPISLNPYNFY
jgi:hypothetical protein